MIRRFLAGCAAAALAAAIAAHAGDAEPVAELLGDVAFACLAAAIVIPQPRIERDDARDRSMREP